MSSLAASSAMAGAAQGFGTVAQLEGQHALGHAHQHHMRPLQPFGGMQGGQGDDVLVLLALADGGEQGDGLRDFQQAFDFARR